MKTLILVLCSLILIPIIIITALVGIAWFYIQRHETYDGTGYSRQKEEEAKARLRAQQLNKGCNEGRHEYRRATMQT
jgi:uncharacterized protein YxeA